MRRRKHEADIEAANRGVQRQPETARIADHKIEDADAMLTHLSVREAETTKILNGRRQANAAVADIDDRLAHDLRVRTRMPASINRQRSSTRSANALGRAEKRRCGIVPPADSTNTQQPSRSKTVSALGPAISTAAPSSRATPQSSS